MGAQTSRKVAAGVLAALLGLGAGSCGDSRVLAPVSVLAEPAPDPRTPVAAVQLLDWSYERRSLDRYRELFTDDFLWECAPDDSSGRTPWTREDELASAAHLFLGGHPDLPRAHSIRLILDSALIPYPDPAFAASDPAGRWHRVVHSAVELSIVTVDGRGFEIRGGATFSLVRGDSAVIPEDLRLRGFGPDSLRWYVRGWGYANAEIAGSAPSARSGSRRSAGVAAPARAGSERPSWCLLKTVYR